MAPSRKYRLSVLVLLVIIAALWGGIALAGWGPNLGLDLQGGISVVLTPKEGSSTAALDKAIDIIRNRVDALGVAEPEIARQGDNVLIQLPGIKEPRRALRLIGTTAKLRFRPVLEAIPPGTEQYAKVGPKDCGDPATYPEDVPTKEVVLCARERTPDSEPTDPSTWTKLRLGPTALEGTDVRDASATLPPQAAVWEVDLKLTGEGARKFQEITAALVKHPVGDPKRQLAIVLDRVAESHPQMGEDVPPEGIGGGTATITGNFGERESKDLALVLRYGSLPVELVPQATTTVSPTLGRDSLRAGLLAGLIGLVIVFIYMLAFYRVLGFVVWSGLAVHAAITLGIVVVLGETVGFALTLAGIAGLIVSIGIAADSFIVYFERLKDEVHAGKSVRASVDRAWTSARRTIVAADLVTALAAVVLYLLAVGSVRGFALMLGLSTALDLIISYFFMHPVVWMLAQTRAFNEGKTFGIRRVVGEARAVAGGSR